MALISWHVWCTLERVQRVSAPLLECLLVIFRCYDGDADFICYISVWYDAGTAI